MIIKRLPKITAELKEGQVSGNSGCNNYFGDYQVDGSSLSIEVGGLTMMHCLPEELMEQENNYISAINRAGSYQVSQDKLHIIDTSGEIILEYRVLEPAPLTGTPWQLVRYNNGKGGVSSVLAGSEITAEFGNDGRITGFTGCNNYTGSLEVDGSYIFFEPMETTRKTCQHPEGIMEQENSYLTTLNT